MKKKKIETLSTIEVTIGEFGRLQEIYGFLQFVQEKELTLPDVNDKAGIDQLFVQYTKHRRRQEMEYISELRVKRGEKPLSKRFMKSLC